MTEASLPLTTWTRFRVPELYELDYQEGNVEDGVKLAPILLPIFNAPVWESGDAFNKFRVSPASGELTGTLSSLISPPSSPTATVVRFGHQFTRITLAPHTQIRRIYFPSPISDEKRAEINTVKKLDYPYGIGISGQSEIANERAYHRPPAQAWANGEVHWGGQQCEVLFCVLFWKSEENEREFLENVRVMGKAHGETSGTSVLTGMFPVREYGEKKLKSQGALGWEDEYVDFEMINWCA